MRTPIFVSDQYKLARKLLKQARTAYSPYVRSHLVKMVLACRQTIARNRQGFRVIA